MNKLFSKLLLLLSLIILTVSSVCYADEVVAISETYAEAEVSSSEETTEDDIYSGDLYLFDNNIVMDKLVDGNVFIIGNKVNITGKINGNLFVLANELQFNESVVSYSIYACANTIYYNGGCHYGDLYVASNSFESTYDSFVARDLKLVSSNTILKSAIGRDADLISNYIDLGKDEDIPVIYNNLRYSAVKEIEIPEGVITEDGSVEYIKRNSIDNSIGDILIGFATSIVTVLAIYIILSKLTPNFLEKLTSDKLSFVKLLKLFGIGFATLVVTIILFTLLFITIVGIKFAFILALMFAILCLISVPVLSIKLANILKPVLKIEKVSMYYLILILVSIILYGLGIIPLIGGLLGLVIKITAIGSLVSCFIPHKELTEEEKTAIEEAKKQAKEMKKNKKQEKLETKNEKKTKKSFSNKQKESSTKKTKKENKE